MDKEDIFTNLRSKLNVVISFLHDLEKYHDEFECTALMLRIYAVSPWQSFVICANPRHVVELVQQLEQVRGFIQNCSDCLDRTKLPTYNVGYAAEKYVEARCDQHFLELEEAVNARSAAREENAEYEKLLENTEAAAAAALAVIESLVSGEEKVLSGK